MPLISLPYNSYLSYLSHTTHISPIYHSYPSHILMSDMHLCPILSCLSYLSHTPHNHPIPLISVPCNSYLSNFPHINPYPTHAILICPISLIFVQYTHVCPIPLIFFPYPISVPIPLICTIPLIISNLAMYTLLCYAFSSPCSNLLMMDPPSSNETSLSTVRMLKLDIATPSWSDACTCSSSWGRSSHSWSHDQICHGTVGKNKALVMFGLLV